MQLSSWLLGSTAAQESHATYGGMIGSYCLLWVRSFILYQVKTLHWAISRQLFCTKVSISTSDMLTLEFPQYGSSQDR